MKPQKTRELLVTTKVAQNWNDEFELRVDELMNIVSRIDNETEVMHASEMMDVYHNSTHKPSKSKRKKIIQSDRPFEFLVFRN
jgi:hypothetical protein